MNNRDLAIRYFQGLTTEEVGRLLPEDLVLLGYRGSIAHGCHIANTDPNSIDDIDVMGVFVGSPNHYLGLKQKDHHEVFIGAYDAVSYELRKFVTLLVGANPNVLGLLWLKYEHYIYRGDIGNMLIANRNMFVSQKIFYSFTGYAHAQLNRMERFATNGYMGEKRKKLVEKYGYDCKNAAHLIRLLRMGIEFLKEGELHVFRDDAAELLEIKRGEWTIERVKAEAEKLFREAEVAHEACTLPHHPDVDKINDLLVNMLSSHFGVRFHGQ